MKLNINVRIKNKTFWITFIPTLLLLVQQVGDLFGIHLELSGLSEQLISIVGTVFIILALLGVVVDPTTAGVGDSNQAMTYTEPKTE